MEVLVIAWVQRRATIYQKKKENKNENIGKFVGAKDMHCFIAKQSMNETIYPENLGHFIAIFLQQFRGTLICSWFPYPIKKNRIIWNILVMCFSNNTLAKLNIFFLKSIFFSFRLFVFSANMSKIKMCEKQSRY